MHKKKYFILMPPALIIGIFLIYYFPVSQKPYLFLIPLVFWIIYYTWIYFEKRHENRKENKYD